MIHIIQLTSAELETLQAMLRFTNARVTAKHDLGYQLTKTRLEDLSIAVKSVSWHDVAEDR